jgi:hypothetical protein
MLLVTVPHARREASLSHDEGAIRMVPYLKAALDTAGIDYEFLIGDDTFRGIIDLNRGEARNTPFAKEMASLLLDSRMHIDLHSFPYKDADTIDEDALTAMGDDLREWSMSDVVLLTVPGITDETFVDDLMTGLEQVVTVDDIQTDDYNFITVFAQVAMDVPSILLELNEDSVPSYPAVAKAVADVVAMRLGLVDA